MTMSPCMEVFLSQAAGLLARASTRSTTVYISVSRWLTFFGKNFTAKASSRQTADVLSTEKGIDAARGLTCLLIKDMKHAHIPASSKYVKMALVADASSWNYDMDLPSAPEAIRTSSTGRCNPPSRAHQSRPTATAAAHRVRRGSMDDTTITDTVIILAPLLVASSGEYPPHTHANT